MVKLLLKSLGKCANTSGMNNFTTTPCWFLFPMVRVHISVWKLLTFYMWEMLILGGTKPLDQDFYFIFNYLSISYQDIIHPGSVFLFWRRQRQAGRTVPPDLHYCVYSLVAIFSEISTLRAQESESEEHGCSIWRFLFKGCVPIYCTQYVFAVVSLHLWSFRGVCLHLFETSYRSPTL